jgi:hypothetical protein
MSHATDNSTEQTYLISHTTDNSTEQTCLMSYVTDNPTGCTYLISHITGSSAKHTYLISHITDNSAEHTYHSSSGWFNKWRQAEDNDHLYNWCAFARCCGQDNFSQSRKCISLSVAVTAKT